MTVKKMTERHCSITTTTSLQILQHAQTIELQPSAIGDEVQKDNTYPHNSSPNIADLI